MVLKFCKIKDLLIITMILMFHFLNNFPPTDEVNTNKLSTK